MRILAILALAAFPLCAATGSAAPAPQVRSQLPARSPADPPIRDARPIVMQLMTVVDHGPTLAGHLVQLPPARVVRVISPTLVVVGDSNGHGNYHFYGANRYDRLLVLLPASTAVARGDSVVVVGTVRTVHGARLSGMLAGVGDDRLKHRENATLLVADSVETPDGVSLARR